MCFSRIDAWLSRSELCLALASVPRYSPCAGLASPHSVPDWAATAESASRGRSVALGSQANFESSNFDFSFDPDDLKLNVDLDQAISSYQD